MYHRLRELLINSVNVFDATRHVSHNAPLRHGHTPTGVPFIVLTIPWTKTTHGDGANIVASSIDDILNPISALSHHLLAKSLVLGDAPLFAYETVSGGWSPMVRSWFLKCCNKVWRSTSLPELSGHCFRIGGATEPLLRGTPPDVIAMQGHWKSRAFLKYWRKIDLILLMFITSSFADSHVAMVHSSMQSFMCHYQ